MVISSKENEIIKYIKSLERKKVRDEHNQYVVEGLKIVEEAVCAENVDIYKVVISESKQNEKEFLKIIEKLDKNNVVIVKDNIFKYLCDTVNPQGIIAIVNKNIMQNTNKNEDIIFVLDNIQDPGNLGTIIRSLDSSGLKQIILSKDTVDCYNSKVVRSSMGAIFRVNILENQDIEEKIRELKLDGYKIITTSLDTDKNHFDIEYKKCVIIIGNESKGVRKNIQDLSDIKIKIPMLGKTESLNASVAASIIMYETVRQNLKKFE